VSATTGYVPVPFKRDLPHAHVAVPALVDTAGNGRCWCGEPVLANYRLTPYDPPETAQ
jgi:hypothetical protein